MSRSLADSYHQRLKWRPTTRASLAVEIGGAVA